MVKKVCVLMACLVSVGYSNAMIKCVEPRSDGDTGLTYEQLADYLEQRRKLQYRIDAQRYKELEFDRLLQTIAKCNDLSDTSIKYVQDMLRDLEQNTAEDVETKKRGLSVLLEKIKHEGMHPNHALMEAFILVGYPIRPDTKAAILKSCYKK